MTSHPAAASDDAGGAWEQGVSQTRSPRRARVLVIIGIVLVALNLRTATTAVSPVLAEVSADIGLTVTGAGVLGMLPPVAFAVFGVLTPMVIRRLGLERATWVAMGIAAVGQLLRAAAPETVSFLVLSVLALGGMGMGNVVLPPLVKKWFPDHIGPVTGGYVLLLAVGTAIPPLFAVPVAEAFDWRLSVGQWGATAAIAMVPWIVQARRPGPVDARSVPAAGTDPAHGTDSAHHYPVSAAVRSPVAWGLAALIGVTSLTTYAMFAWLPQILVDAGMSEHRAGVMLSVFAAVGMPMGVLVPWLAARMRNPMPIVLFGLVAYAVGYIGLAVSPMSAPLLWVVAAGIGPCSFPLSLALVNLRSRTSAGSAVLSGFSQGVGYLIAATGPVVVAALREATGDWTVPLAFLGLTLVVQVTGGYVVSRPDRAVEDDLVGPPEEYHPVPERMS